MFCFFLHVSPLVSPIICFWCMTTKKLQEDSCRKHKKVLSRIPHIAVVVHKQRYVALLRPKNFWEQSNIFHHASQDFMSGGNGVNGGSGGTTTGAGGRATQAFHGPLQLHDVLFSSDCASEPKVNTEVPAPPNTPPVLCSHSPFSMRAPPALSLLTAVICGQAASPSIPPSLPPSSPLPDQTQHLLFASQLAFFPASRSQGSSWSRMFSFFFFFSTQ